MLEKWVGQTIIATRLVPSYANTRFHDDTYKEIDLKIGTRLSVLRLDPMFPDCVVASHPEFGDWRLFETEFRGFSPLEQLAECA